MSREFRQLDMIRRKGAAYLVTIRLTFGGVLQVEETVVPRRNLHPFVAERRGPPRNLFQVVERRIVARELRQKNCRTFDGFHRLTIFR